MEPQNQPLQPDSAIRNPYAQDPQQSENPQMQPQKLGEQAGMRMLLPVGRSGWAIAAGYLGLLSLAIIPAPLALITGIIAIIQINKSKLTENKKHGMGRAIFGVIMGIIGSIILTNWAINGFNI